MNKINRSDKELGFTSVELLLACIIFPLIVFGLANAFDSLNKSYTIARQYNEMYTVLSACPEIDRALEFNSLNSNTNCFPNNTFEVEGGSGNTFTYSPDLTVEDTNDLDPADPLHGVPDSKIVDISVPFPNSSAPDLRMKMLVTRNGIGQQ